MFWTAVPFAPVGGAVGPLRYLSFFSSSWLMWTSCPEASWDFLVMDSSSASMRIFSLARTSAFFSPERTFPSRTENHSGVCEALSEGQVTRDITTYLPAEI